MKKLIALGLALSMLCLTACSGSGNAKSTSSVPQPTTSTATGSAASAPDEEVSGNVVYLTLSEYHDHNIKVVEAFEKKYPKIKVKLEEYPFKQIFDVIEIKLGSQSSNFDVIVTDCTMVAGYAFKGFIQPIGNYFSEEEMMDFAEASANAGTYEGNFYSPPLKNSSAVLFYNKKLLDAANIPYPSSDPAKRLTWEQIVAMSLDSMKAANDPTVWGFTFEQVSRAYQMLPLVNSLGGVGIGDDGLTVDGFVNSPEFVKAMQWYSDIHNKYMISPKGVAAQTETVPLFSSGKVAFMVSNLFHYKQFSAAEGLEWGYAPMPYFEGGKAATPTGSFHVSLSKFSKNPDAAALFIRYLTAGEGNQIYVDSAGDFPSRTSLLARYDTDPSYNAEPQSIFKLAAYEAKNTAVPRPLVIGYGEWNDVLDNAMEDIRNGANVEETLDKAVETINSRLVPYK